VIFHQQQQHSSNSTAAISWTPSKAGQQAIGMDANQEHALNNLRWNSLSHVSADTHLDVTANPILEFTCQKTH